MDQNTFYVVVAFLRKQSTAFNRKKSSIIDILTGSYVNICIRYSIVKLSLRFLLSLLFLINWTLVQTSICIAKTSNRVFNTSISKIVVGVKKKLEHKMCTNSCVHGVGDRFCECKVAKSFKVMQRFHVVSSIFM